LQHVLKLYCCAWRIKESKKTIDLYWR
jgi:hypothetical protein